MKNRLTTLPGTPRRMRVPEAVRSKIDLPLVHLDDIVPMEVRVEVTGGRSSTASAMRAARVQQEMEGVGASALTIELDGERATLLMEADGQQIRHAAGLAFVRRISLS